MKGLGQAWPAGQPGATRETTQFMLWLINPDNTLTKIFVFFFKSEPYQIRIQQGLSPDYAGNTSQLVAELICFCK